MDANNFGYSMLTRLKNLAYYKKMANSKAIYERERPGI
jgi:hypothetical protein